MERASAVWPRVSSGLSPSRRSDILAAGSSRIATFVHLPSGAAHGLRYESSLPVRVSSLLVPEHHDSRFAVGRAIQSRVWPPNVTLQYTLGPGPLEVDPWYLSQIDKISMFTFCCSLGGLQLVLSCRTSEFADDPYYYELARSLLAGTGMDLISGPNRCCRLGSRRSWP